MTGGTTPEFKPICKTPDVSCTVARYTFPNPPTVIVPEPPGTPAEPFTDKAEAPAIPEAFNASVVLPPPSGITTTGEVNDTGPGAGPAPFNAKK